MANVIKSSRVFGAAGSVVIPARSSSSSTKTMTDVSSVRFSTLSFFPYHSSPSESPKLSSCSSLSGASFHGKISRSANIPTVHGQGKSPRIFLCNDLLLACPPLEACSQNYSSTFAEVEGRKAHILQKNPVTSHSSLATLMRTSSTRLWRSCQVKNGEMEGNLSNELILDEQSLQQDLEKAIKEENYALAAKLRDDLRLIHEDSRASVLSANGRFYNAFRNGDFVAMHSIWAKGDNVSCVHPGAGTISGYDLVMSSWEVICGSEHEFPIMIDLKDVNVHVRGEVGYVTCLEVVKTKGGSWGRQVATNVFERVEGKWLMCIHHASHVDM